MNNFDFQAHLKNIYDSFPQAKRQPVIGLTANFKDGCAMLMDQYYRQVVNAGGTPVLIPPVDSIDVIVNTLDHIDALILTGGADFNPLWAGEEPSPLLHSVNPERDLPELLITQLAYNRQIPILGICRGMQTMAMALGGKVAQDIAEHFTYDVRRALAEGEFKHFLPLFADKLIQHSQDAPRNPCFSIPIRYPRKSSRPPACTSIRSIIRPFAVQAVSFASLRPRLMAFQRPWRALNTSPYLVCNGIPNGWKSRAYHYFSGSFSRLKPSPKPSACTPKCLRSTPIAIRRCSSRLTFGSTNATHAYS